MSNYGKELILDLHECNSAKFNRKDLKIFFEKLVKLLDMQAEKLTWWDDLYTPKAEKETEPHLVGTSAVQFIRTSNITIHTLDIMKRVYLNIFSCKDFDAMKAWNFCKKWFEGDVRNCKVIERI